MKTNVRVIWKNGYIKLSLRRSGKTKIISLNIKAKKADFNPKTQRLRASAEKADIYNGIIQEKLDNYRFLPHQIGKITTFITFYQSVIDKTINLGTKEKYTQQKLVFKKFLENTYGKDDIFFEELTEEMVLSLQKYLLKTNSNNTVIYNLRGYKAVLSKANKQNVYTYVKNPFLALEMKFEDPKIEYLTKDELQKLIKYQPIDYRNPKYKIKYSLKDIKNAFIFSVLCQGLRISDVLTLKWLDFKELKDDLVIKKLQFKTRKFVYIPLNTNIIRYLEEFINNSCASIELDERTLLVYSKYIKTTYRKNDLVKNYNLFVEGLAKYLIADNPYTNFGNTDEEVCENSKNVEFIEYREKYLEKLNIFNGSIDYCLKKLIVYLSNHSTLNNHFVFPFLSNELFSNIIGDEFNKINEDQYNQLHNKIYISKLLRKIIKDAGITKNIHFHCARHTYTTLVLEYDTIGLNLFDLQISLGHQSLHSTQKYIRNFYNEKVKRINESLSEEIFSFNSIK